MINVRSNHVDGAEVAWFAPICNGDFEYLGVMDDKYKSSFENASRILKRADELGFRNILCPSSYQVGQDVWTFASAVSTQTKNINLLAAIRCGELWPPMLARSIATLDHILKGRLTINIISSDMPGETLQSKDRYQRSKEVIEILKQAWTEDKIEYDGKFYKINLPSTEPVKPYQQNGGPLLYFGGYSPDGKDLCARYCDVYLMWPDSLENIEGHMKDLSKRAEEYGREIDYGLRIHMIVRETEKEAKEAAKKLMSKLDPDLGKNIRERAQDAKALGVALQAQTRDRSDSEGYIEPNVWTEIGKARSGCGAALVGDPDQIAAKIKTYMDMGIRAFIFSGYPHYNECELFGKYVMPKLKTVSLPVEQKRTPLATPHTPLGAGVRA